MSHSCVAPPGGGAACFRWRACALRALLVAVGVGGSHLEAQAPDRGFQVDSLVVEGNVRVPSDQIVSTSGIQLFQRVNFRDIQRAITRLFSSGQFDDVRFEQRASPTHFVLAIVVSERPVLRRWSIRGASKVPENTVRGRVKVLEGRAIDRAAVERSRAAIDSMYRKKGYYAVEVEVVETADSGGGARLAFAIQEGSRIAISQVVIEGNASFPDGEVVGGMVTKPEGFWWFRKGEYNEDRLEQDVRDNLPTWYADRGFIDFKVLGDSLAPDTIPGKARLIITVDEGPQYKAGTFEIVGNRRYSSDDLRTYYPFGVGIRPGDGRNADVMFSRSEWDAATARLSDLYANTGYIYSSIRPEEVRRTLEDGTHYVDLRWVLTENSPATINKIEIVGNTVTHERVIREAILMIPGQVFNRDLMVRSYQNISNLNFFEQPLPTPDVRPTANNVDVDIVFRVTERRTGNINFGASLGQGTGVGGFIGLEEPNLFGKAKRGRLQWQFGRNINDFNLSYTDPAIRESRVSGTATLFNTQQRFTVGDLGRQRSQGGTVQFGFPLFGSRFTRVFGSYGLQTRKFEGAANDLLSQFSCNNCTRSTIGLSIARDTRIGLPFPTGGSSVTVGTELNGGILGGTGQYQKLDLEGKWFTPLGRLGGGDQFSSGVQFVLGFTAKSGFIIGDTGPFITEQFAVGGVQFGIPLRGYEEFAITPQGFDPTAGSSQASRESFGKAYAAFTLELGARISQSLYVSSFFDAGNNYRRARQYNPTRLFRSFGFGAAVVSPLGPIGIDVGYGLDKVDVTGRPAPSWQVHFKLGNFF